MQDGTTKSRAFSPGYLVWYLSQLMVLEPGDLINTGTPAGAGLGFDPPRYLLETARAGRWHHQAAGPLVSTANLTLGVLGLGRIGRVVAARLGPWFAEVLAHDLYASGIGTDIGMVSLDELFERADVVSVHLPLSEETRGIVDRRRLRLIGPDGYLVNTARGRLVLVNDLIAALDAGELAGAALDVLPDEPPSEDDPVLRHPRVLLSPHVAWYSLAAEADLRRQAAQNILDWRDGRASNQVLPPE